MKRFVTTSLTVAIAALAFLSTDASAWSLRSPQVVIPPTSPDGTTLQQYLNSLGETINVQTDQLDAQVWDGSGVGTSTFTLQIELSGFATQNAIGIYNSDAGASPALFQLFPAAAAAGWAVTAHFGGGNLSVALFDNNGAFQGSTSYTGVHANSFGFYLQGPGGTFFSQDYRNPGGMAQVLTYAGTGSNAGDWFECFEDGAMAASSDGDFQDAVLLLQAVVPTPTTRKSWGSVKTGF